MNIYRDKMEWNQSSNVRSDTYEPHFKDLMQVPLTTEEGKQVVDYEDTYTELS